VLRDALQRVGEQSRAALDRCVGGDGVEIHAEPSKIRSLDAIVRVDVSSSFTDTETCGSQAALYGALDGSDGVLP
jgi:hypothetical protein